MSEKKKTLLIIVDWFAPGYKAGGPIKSTVNLAFALKDKYNINVLTTDTDHGEINPYQHVVSNEWTNNIDENIQTFYLKKAGLSAKQLKKQINESNADFIYLNHIWSPYFVLYPLWLKLIGRIKAKVIVCPRGALYDSALSVKPIKKWPLLKLMRFVGIHNKIHFHATNQREYDAIQRFFPGGKISIVDNLPSAQQQPLNQIVKESGKLKCIFVARIVAIKNLFFLLVQMQEIKYPVSLSIVGPIEDVEYWEKCKQRIETLPANIQVDYLGPKTSEEIIPLIHAHHLYISPTTGENFGHSIFEAFLAGRPVLISDQTPWLALEKKNIGWDVPLNEPLTFIKVIESAVNWNQEDFNCYAKSAWTFAKEYLANSSVKEKYAQLFS